MKPSRTGRQKPQQDCSPAKIRPELNIEKWSIWQPANSRGGPRARTLEREMILPDGTKLVAKLKVGFTDEGSLTTEEQKVYYALIKQWEDRGCSSNFTPLSLQRLAKTLRKPWGQKTRALLQRSLVRLRVTPFVWERSYLDGSTGNTLQILDTFNILSDLKIVRRENDGHVTTEAGYFRFHKAIIKNLLANHTKPVLLDTVLSFKSDIAQIIYTHLDLILSDKRSYERRTGELFEDLGLEGKEYSKLSARARRLEPALKELQGLPLTTGTITRAELEKTKDGADFKAVFWKGRAIAQPTTARGEPESRADVTPLSMPEKDRSAAQAEELVRHFHRVFHGAEAAHPTAKALDQAASLIARLGIEKARHVVDFARREASKTRYQVATFGGVLQYVTPALHEFERTEQDRDRQRRAEAAREAARRHEAEEQAREEVEAAAFQQYWDSLDAAQREAFTAEALAHAERYGLSFQYQRYHQQRDKTGATAVVNLRIMLRAHFGASPASAVPPPAPQ